jgi:hypothetical protein
MLAIACCAVLAHAQTARKADIVAAGATDARDTQGLIHLRATAGQPVIGNTNNGATSLGQGFWHEIGAGLERTEASTGTLPADLMLYQNAPNPFSASTLIRFDIPRAGPTILRICSITGAVMKTLVDENAAPSSYRVDLDARDLPSGVFLITLESAGRVASRRMTIIR